MRHAAPDSSDEDADEALGNDIPMPGLSARHPLTPQATADTDLEDPMLSEDLEAGDCDSLDTAMEPPRERNHAEKTWQQEPQRRTSHTTLTSFLPHFPRNRTGRRHSSNQAQAKWQRSAGLASGLAKHRRLSDKELWVIK